MGTSSHLGARARKNCGWWVSGDRKHCGVRQKEDRLRPIRMSELFLAGVVGALAAAVTASLVFPLVNRIAMAVRAVDYPGGRRLQREAIPRMGGIAIAAGIAVGAFLPSLMIWQRWVERATSVQSSFLFIGTALVFAIGLADDIVGLSCIQRFLVQVMAAAGVVYGGWSVGRLYVPLWREVDLGLWGGLVTVIW